MEVIEEGLGIPMPIDEEVVLGGDGVVSEFTVDIVRMRLSGTR